MRRAAPTAQGQIDAELCALLYRPTYATSVELKGSDGNEAR